jgi:hypothetical protein
MSSVGKDSFTYFTMHSPFISFACLFALARNSHTILESSTDRKHPWSFPDLDGTLISFLPWSMMVAVSWSLLSWGNILYSLSTESVYGELVLDCTQCFFPAVFDVITCFLFFNLLWWVVLIDIWMLLQPQIPEINSTWSWCTVLFIFCWTWLFLTFFEDFHVYKTYWFLLFLPWNTFVWFWD